MFEHREAHGHVERRLGDRGQHIGDVALDRRDLGMLLEVLSQGEVDEERRSGGPEPSPGEARVESAAEVTEPGPLEPRVAPDRDAAQPYTEAVDRGRIPVLTVRTGPGARPINA
jgi:hypothetical protein